MPVLATAIRQLRDYKYGRKSLVSQKMEFSRQRGPKTYPCGLCGGGTGRNSVECTQCLHWIHR